jgi:hypothetical protein
MGPQGSPGPTGAPGIDGKSTFLADGAGNKYPLITVSTSFYGGDALVLINGLIWDVTLPTGIVQGLQLESVVYPQAGCVGQAFVTEDGNYDNAAIEAVGATNEGAPAYEYFGPTTSTTLSWLSRSDGHGGCEASVGASATARPVMLAGTAPANLTRPLRIVLG